MLRSARPHTPWLPNALRALALACLALLVPGPALGSPQSLTQILTGEQAPSTAEPATAPPDPIERAQGTLAKLGEELAAARARLEGTSGEAATVLTEELQILQRIESHLRQQVVTAEQLRAEAEARDDLVEQVGLVEAAGPALEQPYGFLTLDSILDRLLEEEQREQRLAEAVEVSTQTRTRARETLDERQTARRQAREAVEGQPNPPAAALRNLRRAELETRAAEQNLVLRQLELERDQTAHAAQEQRVRLARAERDWVARDTDLTPEDRERVKTELDLREKKRRSEEETLRRSFDTATSRWLEARQRLEDSGGNDPVLRAEADARHAEQRAREAELETVRKRLDFILQMREVWEHRFDVFLDNQDVETVRQWVVSSTSHLETLRGNRLLIEKLIGDARRSLATLDTQIEATPEIEVLTHLRRRRVAEQALVQAYEDQLTAIGEVGRLREKLLESVREQATGFGLFAFLSNAWDDVRKVWNHELTQIDDNPITLGKIVWGLLILIFGGFVAKRLSRLLGAHVLPNFRLNEGALHAFEVLSFYVLVITFGLFALKVVNIPLTAFTILGGALAIGFGFGSQNIVNNFISGLILLTEQPVRVGDLIQIGELYGTVQHIGLRSTRLRTGENVEIIVPNSSFLEQNVVNWTLNDTKTRIKVTVGVAYGSETRKVKDILKLAATEHGRVLKTPEPIVIFNNFGDNALEFELHFWIHMKKLMDRKLLESDIRFRIDSLCREADITIAFPQRDLHIDTVRPLQVQIVPPDEGEDDEEEETRVIP